MLYTKRPGQNIKLSYYMYYSRLGKYRTTNFEKSRPAYPYIISYIYLWSQAKLGNKYFIVYSTNNIPIYIYSFVAHKRFDKHDFFIPGKVYNDINVRSVRIFLYVFRIKNTSVQIKIETIHCLPCR